MILADRAATSDQEIPVFFPAAGNTLFGILTQPLGHPLGTAVIILEGGGNVGSVGRNRIWVRLSRRLSAEGFHTFRFDYHGVGDSTGTVHGFRLDEPFTEDFQGALGWLRGRGIGRFVVIGSCFGSRTALAASSEEGSVQGMVLVSAPVRDFRMGERMSTRLAAELSTWQYLRRALRPRVLLGLGNPQRRRQYLKLAREKGRAYALRRDRTSDGEARYRLSQNFLGSVERLVRHRVPTLFVYGESEDFYREFEQAREGRLGYVLEQAGRRAAVVTLPGTIHGYTTVIAQEQVVGLISDWLVQKFVPKAH
jgi:pimeloyl-ACP methyl ester carboxylesterase